jgi:aerobic C4-dicarboxylate transport protein
MTQAALPAVSRSLRWGSLFHQVLAAVALGVLLGVFAPGFAVQLKVLSDAFLKLISMIVAPIVFCVVVHGVAGAGDLKKVGRVGVKALVYFEAMTTLALALGLLAGLVLQPGAAMNVDASKLDASGLDAYANNARNLQGAGVGSFLLNLIPSTAFDAFTRNDVLQVLFFALLFGVSLSLVGGETAGRVTRLLEDFAKVLFRLMGIIVRTAPLGVLGAIAFTVARYGVGSLVGLAALVALFYATVAVFVLVALGGVLRARASICFAFWPICGRS